MSYDVTKLAKLEALKALAERVKSDYATKIEVSTLSSRVDNLVSQGGEPNVLEGVKVNGTALAIADKMVDILVATGSANGSIEVNGTDISIAGLAALAYKSEISETELAAALKTKLNNKANSATTLSGYGITDAYTKAQVDGIISSVYKPAGSIAFANLPTPGATNLGNVYNVTDAFTTTSNYIEGAGKKHPAGTNVVVVQSGNNYKYDVLAGFVDLSGYVEKESGKSLMTDAERTKLAGIEENANNYTHPSYTAHNSGLYKITISNQGHVTNATAAAKADITGLGIPGQDTTYNDATATAHGLMPAADKSKLDGMIIATADEVTEMLNEVFA